MLLGLAWVKYICRGCAMIEFIERAGIIAFGLLPLVSLAFGMFI